VNKAFNLHKPDAAEPADVALLREIRDELKKRP
jgi:large-conductance mechanosensitive channel